MCRPRRRDGITARTPLQLPVRSADLGRHPPQHCRDLLRRLLRPDRRGLRRGPHRRAAAHGHEDPHAQRGRRHDGHRLACAEHCHDHPVPPGRRLAIHRAALGRHRPRDRPGHHRPTHDLRAMGLGRARPADRSLCDLLMGQPKTAGAAQSAMGVPLRPRRRHPRRRVHHRRTAHRRLRNLQTLESRRLPRVVRRRGDRFRRRYHHELRPRRRLQPQRLPVPRCGTARFRRWIHSRRLAESLHPRVAIPTHRPHPASCHRPAPHAPRLEPQPHP